MPVLCGPHRSEATPLVVIVTDVANLIGPPLQPDARVPPEILRSLLDRLPTQLT